MMWIFFSVYLQHIKSAYQNVRGEVLVAFSYPYCARIVCVIILYSSSVIQRAHYP